MAKANGGHQYIRLRGRSWWYQRATPLDLQSRLGKKTVERNLQTSDLREAQRLRWITHAEIEGMFEVLRADRPITTEEIEAERNRIFAQHYAHLRDQRTMYGYQRVSDNFGVWAEFHSVDTEDGPEPAADEDTEREAEEIIRRIGALVTEESRSILARNIVEARFDAYEAVLSNREIEAKVRIAPTVRHGRPGDLRLSEATARYLAAAATEGLTAQSVAMARRALGLLALFTDNAPLAEITVQTARAFAAALARLEARPGRPHPEAATPFADLPTGPPYLTGASVNHALSACRSLWRWAAKLGHVEDDINPFGNVRAKMERTSRTRYLNFTPAEIEKLLAALPLAVKPRQFDHYSALPWAFRICLYSGLRLDEACGLRVTDILQDDGGWHFDVVENEVRRLKSEAAARRVPVHSALLAMGFLEYRSHVTAKGHDMLFPDLRPGPVSGRRSHFVSRLFGYVRKRAGVTRARVVFHSTRKSFTAALQEAGVPEVEAAVLLGHQIRTITYGTYGGGLSLTRLREIIELVRY